MSVSTGMRNGNLRNALRETIKTYPSDDALLEMVAEAVRSESERTLKLTQLKKTEVSAVSREKNDFKLRRGKTTPLRKLKK